MKTLIIIPAYNESENIVRVIDNLINNYPEYDYLIINDGSKDSTAQICHEKGYHYISFPINLGIGGAVQCGYKYALRKGYDVVVQMDGDGQHDPKYLDEMVRILENDEADAVVGSRFVRKEGFQSSATRRIGIVFLSILGKMLTGYRLKDITSGYRAINRKLMGVFANDYPVDYPEPEAMIIAATLKCRIKEYPVIMRERERGTSSINFKRSIYYMIKVSLAMIVRRVSYGVRR